MKVVVIGGGVAGLAIGWRLAQAKCNVVILERGLAGQGATWAAAGMIAAGAETGESEGVLAQFAQAARAAWPAFAREIETASGMDIALREPGALLVALNAAQETRLRELALALAAKKIPASWLSAAEALKLEPLLAPNLLGALHAEDAALVDNRALGPALAKAFTRAGGKLRENCPVQSFVSTGSRVCGVRTDKETFESDAVVLTAGAWCSDIGDLAHEALPPIRPVKGQMVALMPPADAKMPRYPAWESEVYIVPRRDHVLVGATMEETGFDTAVTREARDWLLAGAIRLAPALAQWRVAEHWAGLRPAAPDGLPAFGPTALEGLFVATGQFRNGILIAPALADAMARFITKQKVETFLVAFDPKRFASSPN